MAVGAERRQLILDEARRICERTGHEPIDLTDEALLDGVRRLALAVAVAQGSVSR